jgi:hypothetical protein
MYLFWGSDVESWIGASRGLTGTRDDPCKNNLSPMHYSFQRYGQRDEMDTGIYPAVIPEQDILSTYSWRDGWLNTAFLTSSLKRL